MFCLFFVILVYFSSHEASLFLSLSLSLCSRLSSSFPFVSCLYALLSSFEASERIFILSFLILRLYLSLIHCYFIVTCLLATSTASNHSSDTSSTGLFKLPNQAKSGTRQLSTNIPSRASSGSAEDSILNIQSLTNHGIISAVKL